MSNMPSRWESSQRPLFVKSIWMDGYRHAILSKEDPAVKVKSSPSSNRAIFDKQDQNYRPKSKTKSMCDGLVIPAVKLLFVNVHRVNSKQQNKIQSEQDVVKSITFNVITRAHTAAKMNKINVHVNLTPNTKSLPTNQQCAGNEKKINIERIEQCSNSLTERVLLWLDLAGRYTSEFHKNMQDEKQLGARNVRKPGKRVATAHPNSTDQKTFQVVQSNDNVFVRTCSKTNICNLAEDSVVQKDIMEEYSMLNDHRESIVQKDITEEYSILNGHRKILTQGPNEMNQENNLISSEVEVLSSIVKINEHESNNLKPYSKTFSKRQVHIFMPLLTKKNVDCNSVLSDNIAASISSINQ